MDKVQAALSLLGLFSGVFTTLHVIFPNVAIFQRLGMALRQLGPKS